MAVGGIFVAAVENAGEIPWVRTIYCTSVDNERAGTGRDGRIRLAKPNSQAQTGRGQKQVLIVGYSRCG